MATAEKKNQKKNAKTVGTTKGSQSFSAKDQKQKISAIGEKKYSPYKVILTFADTGRELEMYFFDAEGKSPKDVVRITSDVDYLQHKAWLPEGSSVGLTRTPKLDNFRSKYGDFDFE